MPNPFKPTALLVMKHNITGLKYFCKTTMIDRVYRYKGSGTAWVKHLREHGFNVKVEILGFYTEEQKCINAAKTFSIENNIVASQYWANAIEEHGKNGAPLHGKLNPFYGKKHTLETIEKLRSQRLGVSVNKGAYQSPEKRAKISASLTGRKNPKISLKLKGRKLSEETKEKISLSGKGRVFSDETKEKLKQAALAQWTRVRQSKEFSTKKHNDNTPEPADEVTT